MKIDVDRIPKPLTSCLFALHHEVQRLLMPFGVAVRTVESVVQLGQATGRCREARGAVDVSGHLALRTADPATQLILGIRFGKERVVAFDVHLLRPY